jgi:hypothetical protein
MRNLNAVTRKKAAPGESLGGYYISFGGDRVVDLLRTLEDKLEAIQSNLDNVTEPDLIDSYVFELKALHMRYDYYIKLCKSVGADAYVS